MKNFIVLFNSGGLYKGNLAYFKDLEDGNGEDVEEWETGRGGEGKMWKRVRKEDVEEVEMRRCGIGGDGKM